MYFRGVKVVIKSDNSPSDMINDIYAAWKDLQILNATNSSEYKVMTGGGGKWHISNNNGQQQIIVYGKPSVTKEEEKYPLVLVSKKFCLYLQVAEGILVTGGLTFDAPYVLYDPYPEYNQISVNYPYAPYAYPVNDGNDINDSFWLGNDEDNIVDEDSMKGYQLLEWRINTPDIKVRSSTKYPLFARSFKEPPYYCLLWSPAYWGSYENYKAACGTGEDETPYYDLPTWMFGFSYATVSTPLGDEVLGSQGYTEVKTFTFNDNPVASYTSTHLREDENPYLVETYHTWYSSILDKVSDLNNNWAILLEIRYKYEWHKYLVDNWLPPFSDLEEYELYDAALLCNQYYRYIDSFGNDVILYEKLDLDVIAYEIQWITAAQGKLKYYPGVGAFLIGLSTRYNYPPNAEYNMVGVATKEGLNRTTDLLNITVGNNTWEYINPIQQFGLVEVSTKTSVPAVFNSKIK